jgi:hypothetical protein
MPFVRPLALHIMRESDYILTGVNYDDLAIATRHNLLQQMVNHGEPHLIRREKHSYLEIGRVTHYHPPCSRLFEYRVDLPTHLFLAI